MMEEQLQHFASQFAWRPTLINGTTLLQNRPVVVCGMGGSHLGARLLSLNGACPSLFIHSEYGLPNVPEAWAPQVLYIASSYSGDTEETLDAAHAVLAQGYALAVITSGGALLTLAKEKELPYIALPQVSIEPRMSMGYQMIALAHILGNTALEEDVRSAGRACSLSDAQVQGEALAQHIESAVPFFYASNQNLAIAYYLKASINETGKIPAAYNVIPELCHNELSGYTARTTGVLPIFLTDEADDVRVQKRMTLMQDMLREHGISSHAFSLTGTSPLHKALTVVLVGNYAGMYLAKRHGVPDAQTPLIGEFKKRLASSL